MTKSRLGLAAALLTVACAVQAAIPYERAVTAPVYGVPPRGRAVAAVASDGNGALLAWNDIGRGAIYATRVGPDGTVLDKTGTRIEASAITGGPWAFWSGNEYLVFWETFAGLSFASVDDPVSTRTALPLFAYDIAFNGTRFVVTLYGGRIAVLDRSGRLIEKDITIPGLEDNGIAMNVRSNGHGFLLTFGSLDVHAVALDASGHPAGPARVIGKNINSLFVRSASDGDEYVLIVNDVKTHPLRIAADGTPLPTPALELPTSSGYSTLSWTGSDYLYTWSSSDSTALYTSRVSALRFDPLSGALHSGIAILTDHVQPPHAVGAAGNNFLLTWSDATLATKAEIIAPQSLTHGAPFDVSLSAAEQTAPHIAFSGRNALVVWEEAQAIYAMRMDDLGRTLDAAPILVASEAVHPNVVFDGTSFVVSWQPYLSQTLALSRIDPDSGVLLDRGGMAIASSAETYDVASAGGGVTMVAWSNAQSRLFVQRVNQALVPLELPLALAPATYGANPSIAWNGAQWLVAFEEYVFGGYGIPEFPDRKHNARAVRLTSSMTPLDTEPITLAVAPNDLFLQHRAPHAASSGDDYLIAWTARSWLSTGPSDVVARHVRADGSVGGVIAAGAGTSTSTVWTPGGYAIGFSSAAGDAVGVMAGKFGDTAVGAPFKISASPDAEPGLALVYANGRLSGAYTRIATEELYGGVSRVFVRDARPMHGRAAR